MYQWVGKQIERGEGLHLSEIMNKQWLCLTLQKIRGGKAPLAPIPGSDAYVYVIHVCIYTYINDEVRSVQHMHMYQVMIILYCEILIFISEFQLLFWIS